MRSKSTTKRQSTLELQSKLELEDLKENLLKETWDKFNFKATSGSTGFKNTLRNSDQIGSRDTLQNFSAEKNEENEKIEKESKAMHSTLKKMLDYKKTNKLITSEILDKQRVISKKERIILQLKEELNYHLNENNQLKINYESLYKLKEDCQNEKIGVEGYYKSLRKKFKKFVEVIDEYESKIKELKTERQQIIKRNEKIIEMKLSEKHQIQDYIDRANRKIDVNMNIIIELEEKLAALLKDKEDQKTKFLEIELQDKIKHDDLEKKYRELTKKTQDYEIIEDYRENEVIEAQMKSAEENKGKVDKEIKLKEYQLKNELLLKQYEEVSLRLTGFTNMLAFQNEEPNKLDRLAYGKQNTTFRSQNTGMSNSTRMPNSNRSNSRTTSLKRSLR